MNFSTIDIQKLKSLPTYTLPATYRLQDSLGNGCYGDPPGYPTYFTQSVYTQHGTNPRPGPQMVIKFDGVLYVVYDSKRQTYEEAQGLLHSLWKPLPLDHPRTRAWVLSVYKHSSKCYRNLDAAKKPWDDIVVYPVPDYDLRAFVDDSRFSEEYREAARAEVAAHNRMVEARVKAMATPENHVAVLRIQKFYPDYSPELDLITNPPEVTHTSWWEVHDTPPTPETCHPRWGKHPLNGTWCQHCGWDSRTKEKENAE